jgi:hypothetical protein
MRPAAGVVRPVARVTVGLGVAMTCWANVVHDIAYGPAGVVISGWPPVALIAVVEVLARMVRPSGQSMRPGSQPGTAVATVAANAEEAAKVALVASIAAGNPVSQRQLN